MMDGQNWKKAIIMSNIEGTEEDKEENESNNLEIKNEKEASMEDFERVFIKVDPDMVIEEESTHLEESNTAERWNTNNSQLNGEGENSIDADKNSIYIKTENDVEIPEENSPDGIDARESMVECVDQHEDQYNSEKEEPIGEDPLEVTPVIITNIKPRKNTTTAPARQVQKSKTSTQKRPQIKEKNHICEVCEKGFSKKDHLVSHMRVHTKERPFACEVCSKAFTEKGTLVKHMRIHTKEKPYSCEVCGKPFSEQGHLSRHMSVHSDEKTFVCEVCSMEFSRKDYLVSHMRVHTKERPFVCEICNKCFSRKDHLITHTRLHTKEKPFTCEICNKTFAEKGHMTKHIRVHTKEKPYNCQECGKAFSERGHVVQHMRVHTKERPYACDECGKAFSYKCILVKHKKIHLRALEAVQAPVLDSDILSVEIHEGTKVIQD